MPVKNKLSTPSSGVLLTTETFEGQYSAKLFRNRNEALKTLNLMRKTNEVDPHEHIKGGFMTTDGVIHRVVSFDDALALDNKVIWFVSQKCFLPEVYDMFDWANYFTTKAEAEQLFKERVEIYQEMIEGLPRLKSESSDTDYLITMDKKPVVYLEYWARPIGDIYQVGAVMLPMFLEKSIDGSLHPTEQ